MYLRINIRTYMRGDLVRIYVCNIHIITQVYFGYNYPFSRKVQTEICFTSAVALRLYVYKVIMPYKCT